MDALVAKVSEMWNEFGVRNRVTLDNISVEPIDLEYLEPTEFSNVARTNNEEFFNLVTQLPVEEVHRRFGEDFMLTAWVYNPTQDWSDGVSEITDLDLSKLLQARATVMRPSIKDADPERLRVTYGLIQDVSNGAALDIDLARHILENPRGGMDLTEKSTRGFELMGVVPRYDDAVGYVDGWKNKQIGEDLYEIFLDGPAGFVLFYKGRPQAVTSFIPEDSNILRVEQLQSLVGFRYPDESLGSKKKTRSSRGLAKIDWIPMMFNIAEEYAYERGFDVIGVGSASNNDWVKGDFEVTGKFLKKKAREIYDQNAIRWGLQEARDWNFYGPIRNLSEQT